MAIWPQAAIDDDGNSFITEPRTLKHSLLYVYFWPVGCAKMYIGLLIDTLGRPDAS